MSQLKDLEGGAAVDKEVGVKFNPTPEVIKVPALNDIEYAEEINEDQEDDDANLEVEEL